MLASIIVIGISAAMFCYWFRYTCSLILSTQAGEEHSRKVAYSNHLQFPMTEKELAVAKRETLERIHHSLDRDYRSLTSLFRTNLRTRLQMASPEDLLLRTDFHALRLWFMVCRHFSETSSRQALSEMAQIVRHFANTLGERISDPARA